MAISDNLKRYFEQYKTICLCEHMWSEGRATAEHAERRRLYTLLTDEEKDQSWEMIVADEVTCPQHIKRELYLQNDLEFKIIEVETEPTARIVLEGSIESVQKAANFLYKKVKIELIKNQ